VSLNAHVKDVSQHDFQESVIEESRNRPVLVDFWASWCAPCRMLGPILEKLAAEFRGDFLLAKVDTEANFELASHFGIRSIPNVKVFKDGAVVDEMIGALPEHEVRSFIRRHCPSKADRKYTEGIRHLEEERVSKARKAFEDALGLDPTHAGSAVELGKILASAGENEAAAELWDRVEPASNLWDQAQSLKRSLEFHRVCAKAGGEEKAASRAASEVANLEARYEHGCCLAARGDYRAALEEFLFVVSKDREFRDQAARKSMLTIFATVGDRSELAEEFRKKLAMVLY
jgi:putative thioredoxin